MAEMVLISSLLNGINNAISIAKAVAQANNALNDVAFKQQIIGLSDSLVESRSQIVDLKNLLIEKDETISALEQKIKAILSKEKPICKNGCYYFEGDENPYCTACWDSKMAKSRTARAVEKGMQHNYRTCPVCKAKFGNLG